MEMQITLVWFQDLQQFKKKKTDRQGETVCFQERGRVFESVKVLIEMYTCSAEPGDMNTQSCRRWNRAGSLDFSKVSHWLHLVVRPVLRGVYIHAISIQTPVSSSVSINWEPTRC
jgi:hypothetical protein